MTRRNLLIKTGVKGVKKKALGNYFPGENSVVLLVCLANGFLVCLGFFLLRKPAWFSRVKEVESFCPVAQFWGANREVVIGKHLPINGKPLMNFSPHLGIPFGNQHLQLSRCRDPAAAPGLGMSLDVKDQPVLGQEEVGMDLHGYSCCLPPFPTTHGRRSGKIAFSAPYKTWSQRPCQPYKVSSVKWLIHSFSSRDT